MNRTDAIAGKAVVIGNMALSSGVLADIALFQDRGYLYLSILGAFVSMFGVIHELSIHPQDLTKQLVVGQIIKGIVIGLLAIPFWFLVLSTAGDVLFERLFQIDLNGSKFSTTVWFIISFYLSWYSVPIFDYIVDLIKIKGKHYENRDM